MRWITLAYISFSSLYFPMVCKAQKYTSGFTITTKGYVVDLGGELIFQPCEDSSLYFLEALDHRSFVLGTLSVHDRLQEAISDVGDTITLNLYNSAAKEQYDIACSYFYCTITIEISLFDTVQLHQPKFINPLRYKFSYANKEYYCLGYWISNKIIKIIPNRKADLDSIYVYYKRNDYALPEWLEDIYNPTLEKSLKVLDYNNLIKSKDKMIYEKSYHK